MNRKIQNILNHAKRMGATHFIEMWKYRYDNKMLSGGTLPIWALQEVLKYTNTKRGLTSSHVFLIKEKPNPQK